MAKPVDPGSQGQGHGQGQAVRVLAQQLDQAMQLLQQVYDGTMSPQDPAIAAFLGVDSAA